MLKAFLSETEGGLTPNTWWSYQFAGHNKEATLELKALFDGNSPFDTPKPVRLLRRVLDLFTDKDSLVLDSFAGSGTTGHAVIQANLSDGGKRRFVLVQQEYDTKDDESTNRNVARIAQDRIVRAIKKENTEASFSYTRVGEPLFGEYKEFGAELPPHEDIAKYIFYTETSREFPGTTTKQNPAWDKKAGRIGEHAGRSYYLLYDPNERLDRGLDRAFLKNIAAQDPNRELVVYCERLAVHQDELRQFHREHGKRIRSMLVPFNLK
jgi:adenine-specific DNA-methyltransferase